MVMGTCDNLVSIQANISTVLRRTISMAIDNRAKPLHRLLRLVLGKYGVELGMYFQLLQIHLGWSCIDKAG